MFSFRLFASQIPTILSTGGNPGKQNQAKKFDLSVQNCTAEIDLKILKKNVRFEVHVICVWNHPLSLCSRERETGCRWVGMCVSLVCVVVERWSKRERSFVAVSVKSGECAFCLSYQPTDEQVDAILESFSWQRLLSTILLRMVPAVLLQRRCKCFHVVFFLFISHILERSSLGNRLEVLLSEHVLSSWVLTVGKLKPVSSFPANMVSDQIRFFLLLFLRRILVSGNYGQICHCAAGMTFGWSTCAELRCFVTGPVWIQPATTN